ncbi:DUF397 domain-containing protein [Actinoallomurus acanthiterrae]
MPTPQDLSDAAWRKSIRSSAKGSCVEVATLSIRSDEE